MHYKFISSHFYQYFKMTCTNPTPPEWSLYWPLAIFDNYHNSQPRSTCLTKKDLTSSLSKNPPLSLYFLCRNRTIKRESYDRIEHLARHYQLRCQCFICHSSNQNTRGLYCLELQLTETKSYMTKMAANNAIWDIARFQNLTRSFGKAILKNGIHVHTVQPRPS